MKSGKRYELEDNNDISSFFNIIIDEKNPLFWYDIMEDISSIDQFHYTHCKKLPKTFSSIKDLSLLEERGVDFNHIDAGGNNFLQYLTHHQSTIFMDFPRVSFHLYDDALEYVIKKTKNIYNLNKSNHHLLFNMVNIKGGGYNGEKFISFVEKYPCEQLDIFDINGQNLINHTITNSFCSEIIDFLLKNKLSYNHKDKYNMNVLHTGRHHVIDRNDKSRIYNLFLLSNDVFLKDISGDNILTFWISYIEDKKTPFSNKSMYADNLVYVLNKIQNLEFLYTNESIKEIYYYMKEKRTDFFDVLNNLFNDKKIDQIITQYDNTLKTISYKYINNKLPTTDKKTIKSKI